MSHHPDFKKTDLNLLGIFSANWMSIEYTRDKWLWFATPVAGAFLSYQCEFSLGEAELDSAATMVAILAGLLFGLLVMILEFVVAAANMAEVAATGSTSTRRRAKIGKLLGANVAYNSLLAVISTVIVVGIDARRSLQDALPWETALVVGVLSHLLIGLVILVSRTFKLLYSEADTAETGQPPPL